MKHIPEKAFPRRDLGSLKAFLSECRNESLKRGHWQLVSISLPVKHIEPLAVLHSIFEPAERHFYLERPNADESVAGAEAVMEKTFQGPDRMREARQFAALVLENTIAFGDLTQPFMGPHFFCGFTFSDFAPADSFFEPGALFVPRWQVSRRKGRYSAVANLLVDAESDIGSQAERVWAAHEKFSSFDYQAFQPDPVEKRVLIETREAGGGDSFSNRVCDALQEIDKGSFEKIVLARAIDVLMNQPYRPLVTLNRLREQFSGCYAFSFANGRGQSFIGVTPERLIQLIGNHLKTMALAGTAPRGRTAGDDARLARSLMDSDKEIREHRVVIEAIRKRLKRIGIEARAGSSPGVMLLRNVQHLWTPIEASLNNNGHILDLVEELHPTPAVGGSPREITTRRIHDLEPFDRSLYAGTLGYFNCRGEGEFVVAIRSALINGRQARVYAGNGIVQGSDPQKESMETELKLNAMLPTLME